MKIEYLKLHIRKYFHFIKAIFANSCNKFGGVIIFRKNSRTIFAERLYVHWRMKAAREDENFS